MGKLIVSLSPHAHGNDSVEKNMYGVVIALIPAILVSFIYFGIGSVVEEGSCCAESGFTDEYLQEHPDENLSLPVGFKAETLEDAKRMAIAFADSVA